mmetsp:Transcript_19391/g.39899  ORF Transcript_19391/g.39899 Transcript_19391/m.39899 type:complete len:121 (+) Transcript_19391:395-757(+)
MERQVTTHTAGGVRDKHTKDNERPGTMDCSRRKERKRYEIWARKQKNTATPLRLSDIESNAMCDDSRKTFGEQRGEMSLFVQAGLGLLFSFPPAPHHHETTPQKPAPDLIHNDIRATTVL